jgi:septum formation protein
VAGLILASSSKTRAELLTRLELPFATIDPGLDERAEDHAFPRLGAREFSLHLARLKAGLVAAAHPSSWVLAADQLAILDGEKLDKPGSADVATEQLLRLSGRTHQLITGVILRAPDGTTREVVDEHRMTMRAFARSEAASYVARHRPLGSAGSYRIEDPGIRLFEAMEGTDFTGILGLPLLACASLLRDAGLMA